MSAKAIHGNELQAAEAFSSQSVVFDTIYGNDPGIQYKRQRVREHVLQFLKPQTAILELNCGTGEDAIFFACHGHSVHATDISEGMLNKLKQKVGKLNLPGTISSEACSFNQLSNLTKQGPYDHIFSNFGGLNCTGELDRVLQSLPALLKPGGTITLVIISKFCLWETLLLFKGQFRTAFRRWFSKNGRKANVEGKAFMCYYYSPSIVQKQLQDKFEVLGIEGLCSLVPPSYFEGFASKYPRVFDFLKRKEAGLKSQWPWKLMGDYFIISLQKRENYIGTAKG